MRTPQLPAPWSSHGADLPSYEDQMAKLPEPSGYDPPADDRSDIECIECEHTFRYRIGMTTVEIKCPRCGGYDTEPA